ncbi:MAG: hypothetical protein P8Z37_06880 [Acidobacteriota bacterium]
MPRQTVDPVFQSFVPVDSRTGLSRNDGSEQSGHHGSCLPQKRSAFYVRLIRSVALT